MRVIAGSARSVPLFEVKAQTTRPMTDRVKTSLFSILDPLIAEARVVDLFAGTGSIGIEALSRGAASCVFVEHDRTCLRTIARNLEKTRLAGRAEIIARDTWRGTREIIDRGDAADIVFFDPPFAYGKNPGRGRLAELADLIGSELLAPDGLLIYHHEFDTPGEFDAPSLVLSDQRRYGRNVVTFLRRAGA